MKNKTKCALMLVATVACNISTANASGKGKIYISGNLGMGIVDKFDYKDEDGDLAMKKPSNPKVFGAALGYRFNDNFRIEISYSGFSGIKYNHTVYQAEEVKDEGRYEQKVKARSLFVNSYYDINKFNQIKPYIGVGLGIAKVSGNDITFTPKHVSAGVNYVLNNKLDQNLVNYRYSNLGKLITKKHHDEDSGEISPPLKTNLSVLESHSSFNSLI